MLSRCRVFVADLREMLCREALRKPHERRPQAAMHERHLPTDRATGEDLIRREDGVHRLEDEVTARVPPPAPDDRLADDRVDESGRGALRGNENDAVLADESERLVGVRDSPCA